MVIKLPRSRESTPVAVTPPSTTLVAKSQKKPGGLRPKIAILVGEW